MTMEMYDCGVDVDVEVPRPAQLTDFGALMEDMGQPAAP